MLSFENIAQEIKEKAFDKIYFLCGEEIYFIDVIEKLILQNSLQEHERDFNLDIFYAKDTEPQVIINAAQQYPSFAERRVVIVREAQHYKTKDWEYLEKYFLNAVDSTILVFEHKHKTIDKRTKVSKSIQKHSCFFESNKLNDIEVPKFIQQTAKQKKIKVNDSIAQLLAENIGNDLSHIVLELEKVATILPENHELTAVDVEKWIGISKEYNITEMNKAVIHHDFKKALQIILYFDSNPKAGNIIPIIAFLYTYFSRLLVYHQHKNKAEFELKKMGLYYINDYKVGANYYSFEKTQIIINDLCLYDAKSKGLYSTANTDATALLKELVYKIMH